MFKRHIYDEVKKLISNDVIPIIVGHRRTGKTTLLRQLCEEYENSLYLNMEDYEWRIKEEPEILAAFENLIQSGYKYFFLDEIQKLKDWDIIVKQLFDKHMFFMNKKANFILTGSSTLTFVNKETGLDRTQKIILGTLTFKEYLELTGCEDTYDSFEHFLTYGAFPKYAISKNNISQMLNATLSKLLSNDIPLYYGFDKDGGLEKLMDVLAKLTNGEFNRENVSKDSGITARTLDRYIYALEKSLVIRKVMRINEKGELGNYPKFKIYINPHFHIWLLNKEFKNIDEKFIGHIIESYYVFTTNQGCNIYNRYFYFKDKDNNEIDFVEPSIAGPQSFDKAIEFKYSDVVSRYSFTMLSRISSKERIIYCKENKKDGLLTFKSIKDLKPNKLGE